MAAVADINGDTAKSRLKDGMAGVALHVVGGLVEVSHTGNVVLIGCEGKGRARGAGRQQLVGLGITKLCRLARRCGCCGKVRSARATVGYGRRKGKALAKAA